MTELWQASPSVDRATLLRGDAHRLSELWQADNARVVYVDRAGALDSIPHRGGVGEPCWDSCAFLGYHQDQPWFAQLVVDEPSDDCVAGGSHVGQRVSVRDDVLGEIPREIATAASAITAWLARTRFCERCGSALVSVAGGFTKRCDSCGIEVFPRQDPVMIVAVLNEADQLLLAHQPHWRSGYASVLAGFVDAGESIEHAIYREVNEEVGLIVDEVGYVASQPWPFPRSLMCGYWARVHGDICVDGRELQWARWYSRAELDDACAGGELFLPPKSSIAAQLIALWRTSLLPCYHRCASADATVVNERGGGAGDR